MKQQIQDLQGPRVVSKTTSFIDQKKKKVKLLKIKEKEKNLKRHQRGMIYYLQRTGWVLLVPRGKCESEDRVMAPVKF